MKLALASLLVSIAAAVAAGGALYADRAAALQATTQDAPLRERIAKLEATIAAIDARTVRIENKLDHPHGGWQDNGRGR